MMNNSEGRILPVLANTIADFRHAAFNDSIEAWASHKSFQRKDKTDSNPDNGANFHGQERRNDTHASKTDPDARLYKKSSGQEAKLSYLGHTRVENRNGLVAAMATQADGMAERDAGLLIVQGLTKRTKQQITVGADKAYDTQDFVQIGGALLMRAPRATPDTRSASASGG
jgi:hypothetical protein